MRVTVLTIATPSYRFHMQANYLLEEGYMAP